MVLTTGSTIRIKAPASKVFDAILDTASWSKWNSWTTPLTFAQGQSIRTPGSRGTLHTRMEAQNRDYDIPVEILEVSDPTDPTSSSAAAASISQGSFAIAWKSLLMPSWFATAERVQIVPPVAPDQTQGGSEEVCELRQWESLSGWGVYLLKWVLGVEKQLLEANVRYAEELAKYAEGVR